MLLSSPSYNQEIKKHLRSEIKPENAYSFLADEAGDIKIIVSPLKKVKPMLLLTSPPTTSFVLSRTILMCMSNASSVPTSCLSFFSCTKISLPLLLFSKSSGRSIPLAINC